MKAFETNKVKTHWVKIKDGKLSYWNGEKELIFDEMQGIVSNIFFKDMYTVFNKNCVFL